MLFGWLRRLGKPNRGSLDRADRNAVIRRIVAAAANESRSRASSDHPLSGTSPASESAVPPTGDTPRFTEDGQPITLLPMGKPPSGSTAMPGSRQPSSGLSGTVKLDRPIASTLSQSCEDDGIPREKVAQRALEIWIRKGRPAGTSEQDWVQAEAELRAEMLYLPSDSSGDLPRKPR